MKHPSIKYAEDILSKKIPGCVYHQQACQRFIDDLCNDKWRWKFDKEKADHAIRFFENCLVLEGEDGEQPFKLFDWQIFLLSNLFGWIDKKNPRIRRFREAYVEGSRGLGKSPLAGGLSIYTTFVLGSPEAQGFSIAANSQQAGIVFTSIGKFADHLNIRQPSGDKFRIFRHLGQPYIVSRPSKKQMLRRLASDDSGSGKSGFIAQFVSADEIHEFKNSLMYDRFTSAMKKDIPTPLFFSITNAGSRQEGLCWHLHERAINLLNPKHDYKNPREFCIIFTLDHKDDPYEDEECWKKANPSLKYGIPSMEFYRAEVLKAKGSPSQEAEVNRALFSVWTSGTAPWISAPGFEALTTKNPDLKFPSENRLKEMRCYVGLDLSSSIDLTSITMCFVDNKSDKLYFRNHSWVPTKNINRKEIKDKSPYRNWEKDGHVTIVDKGTIHYEDIITYLKDLCRTYNICGLSFDAYKLSYFKEAAKRMNFSIYIKGKSEHTEGLMCVFAHQGRIRAKDDSPDIYMPHCIELLESKMTEKKIIIEHNPCLTKAAISSMLASDQQGNRIFHKEKSYSRIDPIVSLVESLGLADKHGKFMTTDEITDAWMRHFS